MTRAAGSFRLVTSGKLAALDARLCLFALLVACGKERPVEAPVIDVAIGTVDGSAPFSMEQRSRVEESGRDANAMTGRWEGMGRQDDGQTWALVVDFSSTRPGVCATADYPTVPCHAQWICTGEENGELHAREQLTGDSVSRCIDNGTMTMHLGQDGMLEWTWSGQGQSAVARLRRVR